RRATMVHARIMMWSVLCPILCTEPELSMTRISRRTFSMLFVLLGLFMSSAGCHAVEGPAKMRVYYGTYTGKESKGIYASELDLKTGELGEATLVAETVSPAFLAIHPSHQFL